MSDGAHASEGSPWSFHQKPYRHYRWNDQKTTPNGLEILSVTQGLGVLDKSGPLVGWAVRISYEGAWTIARRKGYRVPDAVWKFRNDVKRAKLDHTSVVSDAQDRGTATHKMLEDWIREEKIGNPNVYPEAWRGFMRSLARWLATEQPEFLESEVIVGSVEHGYAGTRDTVAKIRNKKRGTVLLDAKTSKGIYPSSHFRQLAAYEIAGREGGENPTDSQGILRLRADGGMPEIGWLQDTGTLEFFQGAFLNALTTCRDERAVKAMVKARDKAAKVTA